MKLAAYPWGKRDKPNKNPVYGSPTVNLSSFRGTLNKETGFVDWRSANNSFGGHYPITSQGIGLGLNTAPAPEGGETAPSFQLTWSSSETTRLSVYVWNASFPLLRLFLDSKYCVTEYCGENGRFVLPILRGFLFVIASNPSAVIDLQVTCVPLRTRFYVPFPCACINGKTICCYQQSTVSYEIVPTPEYADFFAQFQYYINVVRALPMPLTPIVAVSIFATTYRYSVRAVGQIAIVSSTGSNPTVYEYESVFRDVSEDRYVRYYDGEFSSASGGALIQDRGTAIQPCTINQSKPTVTRPIPVLVEFTFRSPAFLNKPYLTLHHEPSMATLKPYAFRRALNGDPTGECSERHDISAAENVTQFFYIGECATCGNPTECLNCQDVCFRFNTLTPNVNINQLTFDCVLRYNL